MTTWQDIATAPRDTECDFWLDWADDYKPGSYAGLSWSVLIPRHRGRFGWSSIYGASPLPLPHQLRTDMIYGSVCRETKGNEK